MEFILSRHFFKAFVNDYAHAGKAQHQLPDNRPMQQKKHPDSQGIRVMELIMRFKSCPDVVNVRAMKKS
jgi:hypothetical protein